MWFMWFSGINTTLALDAALQGSAVEAGAFGLLGLLSLAVAMAQTFSPQSENTEVVCPGCGRVEPFHMHPCPELRRRFASDSGSRPTGRDAKQARGEARQSGGAAAPPKGGRP